jgi:hypothetical protein
MQGIIDEELWETVMSGDGLSGVWTRYVLKLKWF